MTQPIIELQGLAKSYGSVFAVEEVNLSITEGEFLTLLGPSGCGKTTILRMIAGYVLPSRGRVLLDGRDITQLPPRLRNVGMVFQHYALFPHMTVRENIGFSQRIRREPADLTQVRVSEMLALVCLQGHEDKRPAQLSGGQQQRVALARALAMRPRILLMDEPMAALDVKLREQMQLEVKSIQSELGITTIHVTHDQEEALSLSDRVVVMEHGRIVQVDSPRGLYERPVNRYVADFVGKVNFFDGEIVGSEGTLGVRPERCRLTDAGSETALVAGPVEKLKFVGSDQYAYVRVSPDMLMVVRDMGKQARVDEQVGITWNEEDIMFFSS